ncbi:T9SS type A sorting domain-containing protein [Winogradskyella sp. DF17]|uniref:T9SS type A sorting domain-containing protein n=1 Tax=Winogradskyella pelagia TaxID=2819984 RepID=A0ABS3T2N0_9FLAO|nr:M12 family metallo-peptidase [Winogradskyella sp. DF17]MBO3116993.1 T9SS type A sorting domain-containing protein [Winogradskyella sp. DF17]
MKRIVLLFLGLSLSLCYGQQVQNSWVKISTMPNDVELFSKSDIPTSYTLYELTNLNLLEELSSIPSIEESQIKNGAIVSFPTMDGDLESFEVFEASVLAPELQEQLPNVRSFKGSSLRNPYKTVRFSFSQRGLHAMFLNGINGTEYIDAYSKDGKYYMHYLRKDVPVDNDGNFCLVDESNLDRNGMFNNGDMPIQQRNADDGLLRTYTLAMACTEEFADYWIAQLGLNASSDADKKNGILGVMNDFMTRVNGPYERDLGITMEIAANNTNVIFLSSPFLNDGSIGTLINQSQTAIDNNINQSYDIGHMLSRSGSGLAAVGVVCLNGNNARAVSGGLGNFPPPEGIQYENVIMHEMGHQFSARHTWTAASCSGSYTSNSAAEPGGGTTIMAYAGICGASANIQSLADDYFHELSIGQMWGFIEFGAGGNCPVEEVTGNSAPVADAGLNYTIPALTPYKLVGSATDADGTGSLTYCWEQSDVNGQEINFPVNTTTTGPVTRSFPPSPNSTRYIPRLEDYVQNVDNSTEWEILMLAERNMNFTFTVRDNAVPGAQSDSDQMRVTVTNTAGPFRVISQSSSGIVYTGGTTQTIAWNNFGTTSPPVNESSVNILLSVDGGLTFPVVLLANTPNDGVQDIVIPNVDATNCRIMVEAATNIFYNINRQDFEIQRDPLSIDDNSLENLISVYPNPTDNQLFIEASGTLLNQTLDIDLYDINGRFILDTTFSPLNGQNNLAVDVSNLQPGMYLLKVGSEDRFINKKIIIE